MKCNLSWVEHSDHTTEEKEILNDLFQEVDLTPEQYELVKLTDTPRTETKDLDFTQPIVQVREFVVDGNHRVRESLSQGKTLNVIRIDEFTDIRANIDQLEKLSEFSNLIQELKNIPWEYTLSNFEMVPNHIIHSVGYDPQDRQTISDNTYDFINKVREYMFEKFVSKLEKEANDIEQYGAVVQTWRNKKPDLTKPVEVRGDIMDGKFKFFVDNTEIGHISFFNNGDHLSVAYITIYSDFRRNGLASKALKRVNEIANSYQMYLLVDEKRTSEGKALFSDLEDQGWGQTIDEQFYFNYKQDLAVVNAIRQDALQDREIIDIDRMKGLKSMYLRDFLYMYVNQDPEKMPYFGIMANLLPLVSEKTEIKFLTPIEFLNWTNKSIMLSGSMKGDIKNVEELRDVRGTYSTVLDEIGINGNLIGTSALTVIHEIIHSLTVKNYYKNLEFKDQVIKLFEFVTSQLTDQDIVYYGLDHPVEFIAEAFSNEEFAEYLNGIKYTKEQNVWDKFLDIVKNLLVELGVTPQRGTVLYELMKAVGKSFESQGLDGLTTLEGEPVLFNYESKIKEGVDQVFKENPELANSVYEALGFENKLNYIISKHDTNDDVLIKDKITVTKELQSIKGNNFNGSINMDYEIIRERANEVNIGDVIDISDLTKPRIVTINDVLKRFTISDKNKYLLEKLTPILGNIKIEYIAKNIFGNGVGMYSDKYNTIRLLDINSMPRYERPNISEQEVFFHELLHAATFRKISYFEENIKGLSKEELAALNELENIRKILKDYGKEPLISTKKKGIINNPLYGYTTDSIHEIISYAFTNREFRDAIADIPYKGNKSILDKFVELIANIFGVKQDTVLNALLANTEVLLENNQITSQQKQQAQQIYSQFLDKFIKRNFDKLVLEMENKNLIEKKCN